MGDTYLPENVQVRMAQLEILSRFGMWTWSAGVFCVGVRGD
jgi:hypothetical protein